MTQNIYVDNLRKEIIDFAATVKKARQEMSENEKTYKPDALKDANRRIWDAVTSRYVETHKRFITGFNTIRTALSAAASVIVPSPEAWHTEMNLLTGRYPAAMTPKKAEIMSDMYPNDYDWQKLLIENLSVIPDDQKMKYIEVENKIRKRLPKAKIEVYQKIYDGALSLLGRVFENTANEAAPEFFMNEQTEAQAEMFEIIGDGLDIIKTKEKTKNATESALHEFDDISLKEDNGLSVEAHKSNAVINAFPNDTAPSRSDG